VLFLVIIIRFASEELSVHRLVLCVRLVRREFIQVGNHWLTLIHWIIAWKCLTKSLGI